MITTGLLLDIWQDSKFSTSYIYPKTGLKLEPDMDMDT